MDSAKVIHPHLRGEPSSPVDWCFHCRRYLENPCRNSTDAGVCQAMGPRPGTTRPPDKDADPVHLPHHYARFKIEPIRFIMENELPFWAGNVIKYTLRYDAKNGIEDLKKARRYLDMQIAKMEGKEDFWR